MAGTTDYAERAAMLLRAGAFETVFSVASRLAEQVLDERAWQTLSSSLEVTGAPSSRGRSVNGPRRLKIDAEGKESCPESPLSRWFRG